MIKFKSAEQLPQRPARGLSVVGAICNASRIEVGFGWLSVLNWQANAVPPFDLEPAVGACSFERLAYPGLVTQRQAPGNGRYRHPLHRPAAGVNSQIADNPTSQGLGFLQHQGALRCFILWHDARARGQSTLTNDTSNDTRMFSNLCNAMFFLCANVAGSLQKLRIDFSTGNR